MNCGNLFPINESVKTLAVSNVSTSIYRVSQKVSHDILHIVFIKFWPIFKILLLSQSPGNSLFIISYLTSNASLHYLVKYLCQKTSVSSCAL